MKTIEELGITENQLNEFFSKTLKRTKLAKECTCIYCTYARTVLKELIEKDEKEDMSNL